MYKKKKLHIIFPQLCYVLGKAILRVFFCKYSIFNHHRDGMKNLMYLQQKTFTTSMPKIPVKKKLYIDFEGIVPPAEPVPSISVEFPKYRLNAVW